MWYQVPFFWVFGMTRPGIEPQSPGPLANTLLIRPAPLNDYQIAIFTFTREQQSAVCDDKIQLECSQKVQTGDWNCHACDIPVLNESDVVRMKKGVINPSYEVVTSN